MSAKYKTAFYATILSFLLTCHAAYAEDVISYQSLDKIFSRNIHDGLADYSAIQKSGLEDIEAYFNLISKLSFAQINAVNREDQIAFWINTFNAGVIREILKRYPVRAAGQIAELLREKEIQLTDRSLSLDEIRDDMLRRQFRDERILTALVPGRKDSPRLSNLVYRGPTLEDQLNEAVRLFAEDAEKNQIVAGKKKIFLSPVFRTYQADFIMKYGVLQETKSVSESEAAVLSFLIYHIKDPAKRLYLDSGNFKIKYLPDDPRLNEYKDS